MTPNTAESVVIAVIWGADKNGYLLPLVLFNKVNISGANISRVSGINAKNIVDNQIGIGSHIIISRSGDTIPTIISNTPSTDNSLPNIDYVWDEDKINIYQKGYLRKQCSKL